MSILKKGLASFLAALMLVSALPAAAAETEERQQPEVPAETVTEVPSETAAADEVTYNLLCSEITVGTDTELESPSYVLFDENGNYTIPLEDNAFFPYEVQFAYEGDTWTEWFMDPEDTVTVGGHEFSVVSQVTDPATVQQMGVWVEGEYVPAYPEEKTFTAASLMSLLPLERRDVTLDMRGYNRAQLKAVSAEVVLSGLTSDTATGSEAVIWSQQGDHYEVFESPETIDMSGLYGEGYPEVEIIVGTNDQLNPANIRYCVNIKFFAVEDWLELTVADNGTPRTAMTLTGKSWDNWGYQAEDGRSRVMGYLSNETWKDGPKNIGLQFTQRLISHNKGAELSAQVYEGYYETEEALLAANAAEITNQIWQKDPTQDGQGYLCNADVQELTVVTKKNEALFEVRPIELHLEHQRVEIGLSGVVRMMKVTSDGEEFLKPSDCFTDIRVSSRQGVEYVEVDLPAYRDGDVNSYPAKGKGYALDWKVEIPGEWHDPVSLIAYAVEADCDTPGEMKQYPNIKAEMFTDILETSNPYYTDYSQGTMFTVLDTFNQIHKFHVTLKEHRLGDPIPKPEGGEAPLQPEQGWGSVDLHVYGAYVPADDGNGLRLLDEYWILSKDDTYAGKRYRTLFLLDEWGNAVESSTLIPSFYTEDRNAKVYLGQDQGSGVLQTSRKSEVPFHSGELLYYTVVSGNGAYQGTYGVTFLTQQKGGPSLFVNAANDPASRDKTTGLPSRYVSLISESDSHDVFFTNVGDTKMEGLYVRLENAQNVALDEYWTIQNTGTRSLEAFTAVDEYPHYNEMSNIGKVRLVHARDEAGNPLAGEISGTLVIGYDDGTNKDEVRITLTGYAGAPVITTETMQPGVLYVPYDSIIQVNDLAYHSDLQSVGYEPEFSLIDGRLPEGMILYPNGQIYGVPREQGTFTFTVKLKGSEETRTLTLVIEPNTDANVDASTDAGYEVLDRITGQMVIGSAEYPEFRDEVFRSKGPYPEFFRFFLDGRQLVEGQDFVSEEGSTKITIRAQTFSGLSNGTHTIAAEFRKNKAEASDLKRAAQNFTISGLAQPEPGEGHGGHGGGNSKPAVRPDAGSGSNKQHHPFTDVLDTDWFGGDVQFVYEEKLMIGVTPTLFKPYNLISPATVVMVLARMDQMDLSVYADRQDADIPADQWYTAAALWAKEAGLLPEGKFSAQPPIARSKFAVMLYKYLKHSGVDCTLPEMLIAFTDADLMTREENEAFQVLYQFGIFKGVGGYCMDAEGPTTRAQLAVLLHRLSVFAESQQK